MPWKIEARCKSPNCQEKRVPSRAYCAAHLQQFTERENVRKQKYQERRREQDAQAQERYEFYKSKRWRSLRKLQLAEQPLCVICGAPAKVVDHIERIAEGGDRYDQANLQSMCDSCHNKKRSEESRADNYKTPTMLIIGPPFAGKTSYTKEVAGVRDLVVDLDRIIEAISNGKESGHHTDRSLLPFALEARDAIIKRLTRRSDISRAWLITTSATDEEIKKHKAKGGTVQLMMPTLTEIDRRINASERASRPWEQTSWRQLVREWYRVRANSEIPQMRGMALMALGKPQPESQPPTD